MFSFAVHFAFTLMFYLEFINFSSYIYLTLMDFLQIVSIISYITLAFTYIYSYFRPKTYATWLLISSFGNLILLLTSGFLVAFLATSVYLALFPIFWIFIFITYSIFKRVGGTFPLFSFFVYIVSIFTEAATVKVTNYGSFFFSLPFYYILSFILVLFIPSFFSKYLDRKYPQLKTENAKLMKEKLNFIPKELSFSFQNLTFIEREEAPAICVFMGVFYCVLMIVRQLIF